jgi:hypothetical protein
MNLIDDVLPWFVLLLGLSLPSFALWACRLMRCEAEILSALMH